MRTLLLRLSSRVTKRGNMRMRTRVDLDYGYKQRTRGRSRHAPSPLPRPGRRVNTCGPRVGHHSAGPGQHPRRRRRGRRGGLLPPRLLNSMSVPVLARACESPASWGELRKMFRSRFLPSAQGPHRGKDPGMKNFMAILSTLHGSLTAS